MIGRTLYDVTQLLESSDDADLRVRRVLELLHNFVPYQQCAMLEARLGQEPNVVLVPEAPADRRIVLTRALIDLFGHLVEPHARARRTGARLEQAQLAVPLVGLDEVIGLLLVRSSVTEYGEDHLCALSVIAAKLAAYFTIRSSSADLAELICQRDEAWRAVEEARRARDGLLMLVSSELMRPRSSEGDADECGRRAQAQAQRLDELLDQARLAAAELRVTLGAAAPAPPGAGPPLPGGKRRGQLG